MPANSGKAQSSNSMVKSLASAYEPGRRAASWLKVKRLHTLDLVVLAAEWGHGRRNGWLSNLHLAARDADTGSFVMLGKTFKGMTDEMLAWQTRAMLERETHRDDWTVWLRPEMVVEIAFNDLQASPRYPGGLALRFARVKRHRPDKAAADADTIETVRAIYAGQLARSGPAWFEAYLDGRWYTFDPRNNVPRIGRVLIARGRDAADVAITTTFGRNTLQRFIVRTDEVVDAAPAQVAAPLPVAQ